MHQAAGFLYDDLGVRRGDRVATIAYNHLDTVILYFACWLIGAAVAPQNVAEDDRRIAFILRNSEAKVCFVRAEYLDTSGADHSRQPAMDWARQIRQIVQMGGERPESYLNFNQEIANRPDTFMTPTSARRWTTKRCWFTPAARPARPKASC